MKFDPSLYTAHFDNLKSKKAKFLLLRKTKEDYEKKKKQFISLLFETAAKLQDESLNIHYRAAAWFLIFDFYTEMGVLAKKEGNTKDKLTAYEQARGCLSRIANIYNAPEPEKIDKKFIANFNFRRFSDIVAAQQYLDGLLLEDLLTDMKHCPTHRAI